MSHRTLSAAWLALGLVVLPAVLRAADAHPGLAPFELKDGDRVVLIGSTFLEREQRDGYLETALTGHFPRRHVTFRNLASSGDTVFGHARSFSDPDEQGFERLAKILAALEPTVAFVSYGWAESRDGDAGLPPFVTRMNRLLDEVAKRKCRVVLITPPPHEGPAAPLPAAPKHNDELARYSAALRELARQRGCYLLDLFKALGEGDAKRDFPLTDNDGRFTQFGYWVIAPQAVHALGLRKYYWLLDFDAATGPTAASDNPKISDVVIGPGKMAFTVTEVTLPEPPLPDQLPGGIAKNSPDARAAEKIAAQHMMCIHDLEPGRYTLTLDGKKMHTSTDEGWDRGYNARLGPDVAQAEQLREAIVKKNELFSHRWQLAGNSYIFGSGQPEANAAVATALASDPAIAAQEKLIDELRVPRAHRYEITREPDAPAKP